MSWQASDADASVLHVLLQKMSWPLLWLWKGSSQHKSVDEQTSSGPNVSNKLSSARRDAATALGGLATRRPAFCPPPPRAPPRVFEMPASAGSLCASSGLSSLQPSAAIFFHRRRPSASAGDIAIWRTGCRPYFLNTPTTYCPRPSFSRALVR
jgi:hypothetical protein